MGHVVVDIIIVLEYKVFSLMKSTYITVYVLYFLEYWLNDNEMININVRHKMMFLIFFFASHQYFCPSLQQTGISVKEDKF